MSRPASSPPTETPLLRPKTLVATSNHNKAARIMSRHQIGVATPLRPFHVATSKRGRDTVSPAQPQARSRLPFWVATSWRLTYVATSISCRDFVPVIVGLPGRDANIQVATSHTATHVTTSKLMSRPQFQLAKIPGRQA